MRFSVRVVEIGDEEISITESGPQQAVNVALNALLQFISQDFPPPGEITILIADESDAPVATLRFRLDIEYSEPKSFLN